MSKDDYRIWSNADLDYEEWKDWMEEEYPTLSDDERIAMMYEENGHYLEDERLNLDIQLSQPILVVADLGLWNGRRTGYKEIPSGNIRDCLYSDYDYTTWYVDRNGDFRCDDTHHDGTNHYLYFHHWRYGFESLSPVLTDKTAAISERKFRRGRHILPRRLL